MQNHMLEMLEAKETAIYMYIGDHDVGNTKKKKKKKKTGAIKEVSSLKRQWH